MRVEKAIESVVRGVKVSATGIAIPWETSEEKWKQIGLELGRCEKALAWWIADWWAFGEHRYGDRRHVVESDEWQGPSFKTCANAASVARAFQNSRRREHLSFRHHAEVAALPVEEANKLLDWAQEPLGRGERNHSAAKLRQKVQGLRQQAAQEDYQKVEEMVEEMVRNAMRDAAVEPKGSTDRCDSSHSAARKAAPDLSNITGLMGGMKPALELTPQEFKILNQAVNPACTDNEEAAFAVKFIQSIKKRYQVIRRT